MNMYGTNVTIEQVLKYYQSRQKTRNQQLVQIRKNIVPQVVEGAHYFVTYVQKEMEGKVCEELSHRIVHNVHVPLFVETGLYHYIAAKHYMRELVRCDFKVGGENSIFLRPIPDDPDRHLMMIRALRVHNQLLKLLQAARDHNEEFKSYEAGVTRIIQVKGLSKCMAARTLERIIYEAIHTVCDIVSQVHYFSTSNSQTWHALRNLTNIVPAYPFSPAQLVSLLPNDFLSQMTRAGICFPVYCSVTDNGFILDKGLLELVHDTTAGGCPFQRNEVFHEIIQLFVGLMNCKT